MSDPEPAAGGAKEDKQNQDDQGTSQEKSNVQLNNNQPQQTKQITLPEDDKMAVVNMFSDIEEEPRYEPVNGIVQPPYLPSEDKPRRNTNQLQFINQKVYKAVNKHQFAWPFKTPVDTVKYKLPDYHNIIKHPMDLGTIKKRLDNFWYYSSKECIHDFKTMFQNCYTYNKPGEDVVYMAQTLEKLFNTQLREMPPVEESLNMPAGKGAGRGKKGRRGAPIRGRGISVGSSNTSIVGGTTPSSIAPLTPSSFTDSGIGSVHGVPENVLASQNATQTTVNQSVVPPLTAAGSLTPNVPQTLVNQSPSFNQTPQIRPQSAYNLNKPSTPTTSSNLLGPSSAPGVTYVQHVPSTCQLTPVQSVPIKTKGAKAAKGVKRKADTTTGISSFDNSFPPVNYEVSTKMSTRRESGRPIKKPSKELPECAQHVSKARKGKLSEQMKYCSNILKELFAKKHAGYAWPFYKPVDVVSLALSDYYDIIKHPMDLGTVKVIKVYDYSYSFIIGIIFF